MPRLSNTGQQKPVEEKITINLGVVDLGSIDLLVREGFYSTRTDFIRTAIRQQLSSQAKVVDALVSRQLLVLGLRHVDAAELRGVQAAGEQLQIRVLGLLQFHADVTPRLARATIESITVLGVFQASPEIRQALADRLG